MSNFKGTKGKWQFVRYEKTFAIETFGITNWTILQTITNQPQDEANAKLIACATEMLFKHEEEIDVLEKVLNQLDALEGYLTCDLEELIESKKQLIKKATE